jgi:hypothetical protein
LFPSHGQSALERWNCAVNGGILVIMTEVTQILSQVEQGDP